MQSIESILYCIKCGTSNVEHLKGRKYLCGDCENIFTLEDFRMAYKIANKKLALSTGEVGMEDVINNSVEYIYKKGVILASHIEEELRTHVGNIPDEIILARLSYLECTTEDLYEKE